MGFLVAIESDPKTVKDIKESWFELSNALNHKVLVYSNLTEFKADWAKPERAEQLVALLVIPAESVSFSGSNPIEAITELKNQYKCDVLVTLFDDPRFAKTADTWPVQNLLFKPFDLTIFKEHTRFALLKNQKVQTQFVHTTQSKAEIETLKKIKGFQLTECGMKLTKQIPLVLGEVYKFYHPLFSNGKQQHIWARVVAESDSNYELIFAQLTPHILSSIRKKINATPSKVRNPEWVGRHFKMTKVTICIHLLDEAQNKTLTDLLQRNFDNVSFVEKKDLKGRAKVDLYITDTPLEKRQVENQFDDGVTIIRAINNKPMKRVDLQARFLLEMVRLEAPIDKAILVKYVKQLFPMLKEKEPSQLTTISFEEILQMSTLIEIDEYSEAAVAFKAMTQTPVDTMLDIIFSQEDETMLKEIRAKVHYVDEKPRSGDKSYTHQLILFGMKDEFLKIIRLWTLQRHIQNSQAT